MALALAAASCAPPPPSAASQTQTLPAASPVPRTDAPAASGATGEPTSVVAVAAPDSSQAAVPAAPARPPAPPRAPAPGDPRRLIGLTQERLQLILGPADFVRRDGPAQIWRYDAEDCSLDVFLFREGAMQRVTHVASRARTATAPDMPLNACYTRVLGVREATPAG